MGKKGVSFTETKLVFTRERGTLLFGPVLKDRTGSA